MSVWWNTYDTMKIARESNLDVSMTYLLLRDGELLFSHLMRGVLISCIRGRKSLLYASIFL